MIDPAGVLFGIIVPGLVAIGGVVLTHLLGPRLPAEIATHWSGNSPDGLTTPSASASAFALVTVLVGGGSCAIASLAQAQLMMRRVMLVVGLTVVGLMSALQVTMLISQLDLESVADVRLPMESLALGVVLGAIVGMLGAASLQDFRIRTAASEPPPADLPRCPVEAPIVDQVGVSAGGTAVLALIVAAPAVGVCLWADKWWPLAVFLPTAALLLALLRFRVVVDDAGIRVQNMGMTVLDYGVEEVVGARVEVVRPFDDFGGWGLRTKSRGNYGVVTRTGPALVLTTACGQRLTVTSPRAEEMAGTLNTLADARLRHA
ncbi:DUF1648 domain-containing protein [Rhodococcus sp. ABRD24]|uniref:DUF1648 domain-containing protein n=1 Tax=Rhodococcus sp. ABRD24 TaxID=2507582 RepID=UPI00103E1C37|nr:DUF1648 domain-containing protein [Rhodococcus sp. ABRD24]QBJ98673.1 DUF1648 domain-containing protein [Rhodococcus sp. ABRD24]